VLTLARPLDVSTAAAARREVVGRLAGSRPSALEVDASGIDRGDMAGMSPSRRGPVLADLKAVLPPRP
jgi:hypothetical protein